MYVSSKEHWSQPDAGDPPPCFRQGDLVRVRYFQPEVVKASEESIKLSSLDARFEVVALLSACCDLVIRTPPKRKGVLFAPLREVPKNIRKNEMLLRALKASASQATHENIDVPANLFYYEPLDGITRDDGAVVYLESMMMLSFDLLASGQKVAELSAEARSELQERIKFHFTR